MPGIGFAPVLACKDCRDRYRDWVPKIGGTFIWGSHNKDYGILGLILGNYGIINKGIV